MKIVLAVELVKSDVVGARRRVAYDPATLVELVQSRVVHQQATRTAATR